MRLYRAMLRLYPASFRAEYGGEMAALFGASRRRARGAGVALLWVGAALDVARGAAAAHADLLRQDLRFTARSWRRAPGLAATAVVVTALGVGANTAVFSVADHVLLRPLPYPEASRLVKLWEAVPGCCNELSPPNYRDWRERSRSFDAMAAYHLLSVNLVGRGEPARLDGVAVGGDLLPMLGARPLFGRLFAPADERPGAPGTMLLSYGVWRRVFGGDPAALGSSVTLDGEAFTVIGVLPPEFSYPRRDTQMWLPIRLGEEDMADRGNNYFQALARLAPGVTLAQARAEAAVIAAELEREFPAYNTGIGAAVLPLREELPRQARWLLAALVGAAVCVLLIACANLAGLLLAHALRRRKELTVRAALGAGRERLRRQLLTEALALAAVGGVLGVLTAAGAVPLFDSLVPANLPVGSATALDLRVLGFALAITVATGLLFGVAPALRAGSELDLPGLREGARSGLGGRRERLRAGLVVAEVAACLALLVACGLLARALARVAATDPGFRASGVLAMHTPLPWDRYSATARRVALYERILAEVRALPGVESAAWVSALPIVMGGGIWEVEVPGSAPEADARRPTASARYVSPDYFRTLGVPLRQGRDVAASDLADAAPVAVVSESFVRRHWPGEEALGRSFVFGGGDPRTVVGVVGDVRVRGLERPSEPQVYMAYGQVPDNARINYAPKELVLRCRPGIAPASLAPAVRRIVHGADPELPIARVRTLQEVLEAHTAPRSTQLRMVAAFAALSLLLAAVGIHGLLSLTVAQRQPEFSLRLAVGAGRDDILRMVAREGLRLAALGGIIGLPLAYAAGRTLESLLAGLSPGDLPTLVGATAVTLLAALTGSLVPALRALRCDPARLLRSA